MSIEKLKYYTTANVQDVADTVEAVCDSLALDNNDGNTAHISDLINEVVDDFCPEDSASDYCRLIEAVPDIEGSIGDALSEGLIDTERQTFTFRKLLQVGYYEYLYQAVYNNLSEIIFNHLVDRWDTSRKRVKHGNNDVMFHGDVTIDDITIESVARDVAFNHPDSNRSFDSYESEFDRKIDILVSEKNGEEEENESGE